MRRALTLALLLVGAQARGQSLPAQLAPATRDSMQHLLDSARAERLPAEILSAKAAEGVLKRVDEPRILRAVRQLHQELRTAAAMLPAAPVATLSAAATALHSGLTPAALKTLAASKPNGDLAVALVTLSDLLVSGVPTELAASSVQELVRRQASDAEMSAFRSSVARELANGADAASAVSSGMRDAVKGLDAGPTMPGVRKPPMLVPDIVQP